MANKSRARPKPSKLGVYFYIPNIIGYMRVLMNCYAFAICFSNKWLFCALYFISFVCDGIDGWCARKFNQVSTFGAVLDMVTDRISTACLLVILSQVYRPGLTFVSLLALDIASHWLQMYSTFLVGKASHKDVKDSTNWLFKAYYGNRMFMAYCCVACEVLYIALFLLAEKETENLMDVLTASIKEGSLISVLVALSLFGWAIKQIVNIIQILLNPLPHMESFTILWLKTAADACVLYDINKEKR
ncbi:putative CDP-diacylglycerol--inositol 3-phosphatidyltransferase 2 [Turnera subulata]|uniref:CDP-diacylglycerol--inositol 3-phosphatidyltransferase n=1 Tax=Turnera subulata TaxID=218843 RepID=A0A9Q0FN10_9ROSI|nr:putative CDP-diacylglycerol--inositol 3-phosphatidyltransferase 2 [Turnera subulata]